MAGLVMILMIAMPMMIETSKILCFAQSVTENFSDVLVFCDVDGDGVENAHSFVTFSLRIVMMMI